MSEPVLRLVFPLLMFAVLLFSVALGLRYPMSLQALRVPEANVAK